MSDVITTVEDRSYELVDLSVVSGVVRQLGVVFPGSTRYREAVTNLRYPHFFVWQIRQGFERERVDKWKIHYLVNIRYRQASQPELVTDLQENLDRVGLAMLNGLEYIYWNDMPVRIERAYYEKVDGVLQFFCEVNVIGTKPVEEYPLMETLEDVKIFLKEE